MRIQFLSGGLGNQVFQYIFFRFAERRCPEDTWYLDDSAFFCNKPHNGYELERVFGIKANLLSNYFDADVWEEIIRLKKEGISLPQTFLNMGVPLTMLAETSNFSFDGKVLWTPANQFHPEIVELPQENLYYHGYWINKHWFSSYKEENLAELSFPPLADAQNKKYARDISGTLSIGVHIRRGDFVTVGWDLPIGYYKTSCQQMVQKIPGCHFFVFSDDLQWCQENAEALGLNLARYVTYVSGNVKPNNYIDLQLLSMCYGMVMSNSSFCYLAALLDRNLKFWTNPTKRELWQGERT